jgi:transposase InsO family protein
LKERWIEPDLRDQVVDFVRHWHERGFEKKNLLCGIGLGGSKFYSWLERYGKDNDHNGKIPRDYWVQDWEKQKIIEFFSEHQQDGYRRASYMMLDRDVVAVSPATTYRILANAGLLKRWNDAKPSSKGKGFVQPLKPHEHWHIDISYLNICGTFYYFIGILDGCTRFMVHWDIRESMTENDVALVIERAKEKFPGVTPRIISDNGPQFIAKDFKEYIRLSGMTHVRTSPYYPQSNGKLERFNRTMKSECIRPKTPVSLDDAIHIVTEFVDYYNSKRLHSSIGYITPLDKMNGKEQEIFSARDRKLEAARAARKMRREHNIAPALNINPLGNQVGAGGQNSISR